MVLPVDDREGSGDGPGPRNVIRGGVPSDVRDPDFAKEVARKEFPDLPPEVVDAAIDAELDTRFRPKQ